MKYLIAIVVVVIVLLALNKKKTTTQPNTKKSAAGANVTNLHNTPASPIIDHTFGGTAVPQIYIVQPQNNHLTSVATYQQTGTITL